MHVTCMAGKVDVFKQVLVDEEDFLFSVTAFRRSSKVGLIMHRQYNNNYNTYYIYVVSLYVMLCNSLTGKHVIAT